MVNTIQDILDAVQDIFEAEFKALLDAARQQTELVFWIVRRTDAFWVGSLCCKLQTFRVDGKMQFISSQDSPGA